MIPSRKTISLLAVASIATVLGGCRGGISKSPPVHLVLPKQWQTDLNCLTGGDKKISHALALDLAEGIPRTEYHTGRGKMTQALGDTVLIAEWGRRMLRQEVDVGPTF